MMHQHIIGKRWAFRAVSFAVAVGVLAGCTTGNNRAGATVVGAGIGSYVGEKVIGGKTGAAIGIALGGIIGNRIGELLDEQDRRKLAELEVHAVRTNQNGSFVSKRGAQVSVQAGAPTYEDRKQFVFAAGITPQRIVLGDARSTDAYVDTPLFGAPNESQPARLIIKRGVPITVVASVVGKSDWVVVGDGNVGIGYLPARYLQADIVRTQADSQKRSQTPSRPVDPPVVVASQAPLPTDSQRQPPSVTGGSKHSGKDPKAVQSTNTKSSTGKQATPIAPKSPAVVTASKEDYQKEIEKTKAAAVRPAPGVPAVATMQATLECKTIKRNYSPPNSQETVTEEIKYCNEPPKGWQTVTV